VHEVVQGQGMRNAEMLVWAGDFNYRIDATYEDAIDRIRCNDLEYLLERVCNLFLLCKLFLLHVTSSFFHITSSYSYVTSSFSYVTSSFSHITAFFSHVISFFSHVTSSFPYACADPGHHTSCTSFCAAVHVHLFVLHSHAELSSILVSHAALSVPCHVTLQLCSKEQVFAQFDSCLCHDQGLAGSSCLLF